MTLEEQQFTSFNNVKAEHLEHAKVIEEQRAIQKSCNQESWCCAWAPDSSYIAWSQGGGVVYLLPWDRYKRCLLEKPDDRQNIAVQQQTQLFIQNLPTITISDENETQERERRYSENSLPSWDDTKVERRAYCIDCCDYVWSMAFGSGMSEQNIKLWRRFIFNKDLILAVGLQSGKIKLFNVYSGNLLMELLDHTKVVRGLSFTADGSLRLISCSNDCTIKFWDLNMDGNLYKTLRFEKEAFVFKCKWSPNCKQMAAVGSVKSAYVWNAPDFRKCLKFSGHYHNVTDCTFSPDGAIFVTASFDTSVILWDPYTSDMLLKLGHMFPLPRQIYAGGANEHYVRGISFCRDGQHIATSTDDGYIRFWNIFEPENPACIAETPEPLCCRYSPDDQVVATGDREGKLTFFLPKQAVPPLQHLCRTVLRQRLSTQKVDHLYFPIRLKEYLKYKDLVV